LYAMEAFNYVSYDYGVLYIHELRI